MDKLTFQVQQILQHTVPRRVPRKPANTIYMTQRNTTSKTHAPTAGSLASQSGGSSAVGSDRKTHTSSESQTIPEPKQITVVESPTHLQQKTNFTTGSGRNPRNSSSSSSVATIAISSRKTPSPELPASHHLSATRYIHLYEG